MATLANLIAQPQTADVPGAIQRGRQFTQQNRSNRLANLLGQEEVEQAQFQTERQPQQAALEDQATQAQILQSVQERLQSASEAQRQRELRQARIVSELGPEQALRVAQERPGLFDDDDIEVMQRAPDLARQISQAALAAQDQGDLPDSVQEAQFAFPESPEKQREAVGQQFENQGQTARQERVAMLMDSGLDRQTAQNIVAGRYVTSRDPVTGAVDIVDKATGEPIDRQQDPNQEIGPQARQSDNTLWNSVEGVPGVANWLQEKYAELGGQIPGVDIGEGTRETVSNRQFFRAAQNSLIRSLSINQKFPVREIQRIQQETNISPNVWDSEAALKERMKRLDNFLRTRMLNEQIAARDESLPAETRQASAQAAKDIKNFLNIMGVPQGQEDIGSMGREELMQLDPSSLTESELQRASERLNELEQ